MYENSLSLIEEQEENYRLGLGNLEINPKLKSVKVISDLEEGWPFTTPITQAIIDAWDKVASYPECELTPWQNNIREKWRELHEREV